MARNVLPSKSFICCVRLSGTTADYLLGGNVYAADLDDEAAETCKEILNILRECDAKYLESIRDISAIYVDVMKK